MLAKVATANPRLPLVRHLGDVLPEVDDGQGERRLALRETEKVVKHHHLPVADRAGAAADHGHLRAADDLLGHLDRDRFDEKHRRARLEHRVGVGDDAERLCGGLACGRVAAGLLGVLRTRTDVGDDRDACAGHLAHERREGRVDLEFHAVGHALGHEAAGVADALGVACLVAHERHVGHDEGARCPAAHGGREHDEEVERRVERVRVAEDHLGRSVADEEDGHARALKPAGGGGVVAGERREGLALAHGALERPNRHLGDGRIGPGPGDGLGGLDFGVCLRASRGHGRGS